MILKPKDIRGEIFFYSNWWNNTNFLICKVVDIHIPKDRRKRSTFEMEVLENSLGYTHSSVIFGTKKGERFDITRAKMEKAGFKHLNDDVLKNIEREISIYRQKLLRLTSWMETYKA